MTKPDNTPAEEDPGWAWREGSVDPKGDHLVLTHDDHENPVALVGPPSERVFPVQILNGTQEALRAVHRELDFYLVELGEPDPWAYAIDHAGTASNLYASVHWSWHPSDLEVGT